MIRTEELATFLRTIAATVTHELRPDLQSGQARKSADFLIQAIERLAAQLRDGERIGAEHGPRWRALREGFPGAAATAIPTNQAAPQRERLEAELDALQGRLADPAAFSTLASALADRGSRTSRWFREAIIASSDLLEALEDSTQPAPARAAAAAGGDVEDLRRRLSAYLGAKYPALPPEPIVKFDIASGGSTKLTALFALRPNAVLPERLVLRQDLAMSITGASVLDEFPIVEQLHRCGLKVPQPILVEADPAVLGGRFMIMTEIAGSVPAGTYFAKERARQPFMIGPDFARDAAEELARLHTRTVPAGSHAGVVARRYRDELEAFYKRWQAVAKPPNSLEVDLAYAWLFAHPLADDRPQCIIHGDFGVHNAMVRDGRLTGVLDWELAQLGDPAQDIAQARMLVLEDTLPWEEFRAAYLGAGGDPVACAREAVDYQGIWIFAKMSVMLAEARSYYISGARDDSLMASVAGHSIDRVYQYLARSLKIATD